MKASPHRTRSKVVWWGVFRKPRETSEIKALISVDTRPSVDSTDLLFTESQVFLALLQPHCHISCTAFLVDGKWRLSAVLNEGGVLSINGSGNTGMGHGLHSHFQGFQVRSSVPGQVFFAGSQDIPRSHKSIFTRRLPVHGKFTLYPVTMQLPKEYILEASLGQELRTNRGHALHGLHKGFLGVMGDTVLCAFSVPRRGSLENLVIVGQVDGDEVLKVPVRIIQPCFLMFWWHIHNIPPIKHKLKNVGSVITLLEPESSFVFVIENL